MSHEIFPFLIWEYTLITSDRGLHLHLSQTYELNICIMSVLSVAIIANKAYYKWGFPSDPVSLCIQSFYTLTCFTFLLTFTLSDKVELFTLSTQQQILNCCIFFRFLANMRVPPNAHMLFSMMLIESSGCEHRFIWNLEILFWCNL